MGHSSLSCRERAGLLARVGVVATLPLATLTACGSLMADHQRFIEGWRPGRVMQIDSAARIRVRFAVDCRPPLVSGTAQPAAFALVRYSQAPSRYGHMVSPLQGNSALKVGDRVEVNLRRCNEPTVQLTEAANDSLR